METGVGLTETFLDTLHVVILSAASFCSLKQSIKHDLLRGREINDEGRKAHLRVIEDGCGGQDRRDYRLIELESLIHFAGEAIDKETASVLSPAIHSPALSHGSGHGVFQ